MNNLRYILKSIKHYKKQHFAIFLGTVLSTAILTGALVVGDSVRYSLNQLVVKRLGNINYVLQTGDRFLTNQVVEKIGTDLKTTVSGALHTQAILINSEQQTRINRSEVYGIDTTFWHLNATTLPALNENEAYLSENTARHLQINEGGELLIKINNKSIIPVNVPFSQEQMAIVSFRLIVKKVLNDKEFARFSLKSDQKTAYNIWLNKNTLQAKLDIENKINMLMVTGAEFINTDVLNNSLQKNWTLNDLSIKLESTAKQNAVELTSNRIFIDHVIEKVFSSNNESKKLLTYLVNGIANNKSETPYSFVSGISNDLLGQPLNENEIILNDWCANDIGANIGDSILLKYFVIGPYKKLLNEQKYFVIKQILPNQGNVFQQNLTPNFPGLSDAESCSEWDTGVPIDLDKIRDKDEDYWNKYKATPKAIINYQVAKQMWGNVFGNTTALVFESKVGDIEDIEHQLLSGLKPENLGFVFKNIKKEGQQAVVKSVDFGELFVSLSFFVMAAAVLLVVLLHSLNVLTRQSELGLLASLGFKKSEILSLMFYESALVAVCGGIAGAFIGLLYNNVVLIALNSLWNDAVRTHALEIYVNPFTLLIGSFISILLTLCTIFFVARRQLKNSSSQTLKKVSIPTKYNRLGVVLSVVFLIVAILLVLSSLLKGNEINANMFLTAGGMLLVSLILGVNEYFKRITQKQHSKVLSIKLLAIKNMSRKRARSLMAVSLLSVGTFSVIITGANRKTFEFNNHRSSGTGGFAFWIENSIPINYDLNSIKGQQYFNIADEAIMDSVTFIQCMALSGNDASCLNLNQVDNPQVVGVNTRIFSNYKPFAFTELVSGFSKETAWGDLDKLLDNNVIPAYVDQTVITWGLMKKVGDTLYYTDEAGEELKLLIAGGLNNTIFQGNILISEKHFRKFFPSISGSKIMLIESSTANNNAITELLDFYFEDYGIDYVITKNRLAEFNSVSNTYLDVFMILGGLGVAIGTLGFGIVLMRNRMERTQELAVLKAIGFTNKKLASLLIYEHLNLLFLGIAIGLISAGVGLLPSVLSEAYQMPLLFILTLVCIITLSGVVFIWTSARISRQHNLIQDLRNE